MIDMYIHTYMRRGGVKRRVKGSRSEVIREPTDQQTALLELWLGNAAADGLRVR